MIAPAPSATATEPEVTPTHPWCRRALVLLAAVILALVAWQIQAHWLPRAAEPKYTVVQAARHDLRALVTASGTLSPVVQVQVGSQVSGRPRTVDVDFNDEVHEGQRLALIDPTVFESAVAQSRARLESARAALERARAQAQRRGQVRRRVVRAAARIPRATRERGEARRIEGRRGRVGFAPRDGTGEREGR